MYQEENTACLENYILVKVTLEMVASHCMTTSSLSLYPLCLLSKPVFSLKTLEEGRGLM